MVPTHRGVLQGVKNEKYLYEVIRHDLQEILQSNKKV